MDRQRKQNRLTGCSYSQSGAYFITVCTEDRACILSRIVGADAHIGPYPQLTQTGRIVEKYLRSIPGIAQYVIMPNHVHMILRVSADSILNGPVWADAPIGAWVPGMIRSWKTLVTKDLGKSIWQRSYYDHIIRNQREYVEIAEYIQNNPARWMEDDYYR